MYAQVLQYLSQTTQEFKTYVLVLSIFPEEEEECQIL
jgi:hypothetical protein